MFTFCRAQDGAPFYRFCRVALRHFLVALITAGRAATYRPWARCPAGCGEASGIVVEAAGDLACDQAPAIWAETRANIVQFVRDGYFDHSWEVTEAGLAGGSCVLGMVSLRLLLAFCGSSIGSGDWCKWKGTMAGSVQAFQQDLLGGIYDEDWRILQQLPWLAVIASGWPIFALLAMLSAPQNAAVLALQPSVCGVAGPQTCGGVRAAQLQHVVEKFVSCARCLRDTRPALATFNGLGQVQTAVLEEPIAQTLAGALLGFTAHGRSFWETVDVLTRELQRERLDLSSLFYMARCRELSHYHGWSVAFRHLLSNEVAPSGGVHVSSDLLNAEEAFIILPSSSPHSILADPFCMPRPASLAGTADERDSNSIVVFMEEADLAVGYGAGRISVFEVYPDGGFSWPPQPVVEERHHLSYPFVLEWPDGSGALFMVLANTLQRRIDVYRAIEFPFRWRFEGPILEGLLPRDPTLLKQGGRIWLFVSDDYDNDLSIFVADSLFGPYVRHPSSGYHPPTTTPSGQRLAVKRPAGAFFVAADGRLLRPSQESGRTDYGAAILLHEVLELSTLGYREHPAFRLAPPQDWSGVHTLSMCGSLLFVDRRSRRQIPVASMLM